MLFSIAVLIVFFRLGFTRQLYVTTHHVNEGHTFEFRQRAHQPFVDAIEHQQYFNAFIFEDFKMRAAARGLISFGTNVVDALLVFFLAFHVIRKTRGLVAVAVISRGEAQQLHNSVAIGKIFTRALFEDLAKLFPERLILLRIFLGHVFEHAKHTLRDRITNRGNAFVLLQDLARDVEWQIVGVDDALDETKV